ncbi:hypothetical protein C4E15_18015 [Achromobacter spanius]|uniref:Uncharacterized protein n=1 Tax=Achromobacter spanius TaxID=217203 RepID=A0A2S5GQS2_9BURK|nr:hypothetical protein C4E15_18015 [Achromobacter spanius]
MDLIDADGRIRLARTVELRLLRRLFAIALPGVTAARAGILAAFATVIPAGAVVGRARLTFMALGAIGGTTFTPTVLGPVGTAFAATAFTTGTIVIGRTGIRAALALPVLTTTFRTIGSAFAATILATRAVAIGRTGIRAALALPVFTTTFRTIGSTFAATILATRAVAVRRTGIRAALALAVFTTTFRTIGSTFAATILATRAVAVGRTGIRAALALPLFTTTFRTIGSTFAATILATRAVAIGRTRIRAALALSLATTALRAIGTTLAATVFTARGVVGRAGGRAALALPFPAVTSERAAIAAKGAAIAARPGTAFAAPFATLGVKRRARRRAARIAGGTLIAPSLGALLARWRLAGFTLRTREKGPTVAPFGSGPRGACRTRTRRLGFSHGVFQWGGGVPPGKSDSGPLRQPATR